MIFSKRTYAIKEEDRQFLDYIPPVSIFLGGIIFLAGTIAAILLYHTPNGGYQFFDQFFSELGVRHDYVAELSDGGTEQRYAPSNPEIFNVTLFAAGFLMIPFFMFTYRQMRNSNRFSNFLLVLATLSGVAAGPMLIGVGIFDLSYPANVFWQEHGFWSASLYLLITITSILWFVMLLTSSNLPYRTTKWIWLDYLFLLVLTVITVLNFTDGFGVLNISDIPYLQEYPIETYQKLIAYLFFIYYGLVVGTRLTKTKYDNTPVVHGSGSGHQHRKGSDALFCTNCGTKNTSDRGFCVNCGLRL
jgi:hypothetical membrane protein